MTTTHAPVVRPRKITERGQQMLRGIVHRVCQVSAEPIATTLQTSCGLQITSWTVWEFWVSMAEWLHPSHASPSPMWSTKCSCWENAANGLQSSAVVFCGVTNHASLSVNPMDESGWQMPGDRYLCQEKRFMLWAYFLGAGLRLLVPMKRALHA